MNLDHKEQRLKKLLENNIREGKIGTAIAITGSWGVGKTFFWNKFRQTYPFKNKYVYVSLFGLESLVDLKTHIYTNIENNHSAIEIPRWIRGLPSILKDTRISQFGINASAKVFDSLMFNQVKDAIICFDDFERMSNKLDIKDVMGLANQLKLERNCQIILILDESKTEDKNKEKYVDYKEKLIDETIKIISVEPLIRARTTDIEDDLVNLMVRFADELEIHNFRFYQKVINLYKQFRAQLPDEVAYSTKEIILIRVLQGFFIEDFGEKYEYKWEDVKYVLDEKQTGWSDIKRETYRKVEKFSYKFTHSDEWLTEFRKWFDQTSMLDFNFLHQLANSDLISEMNNQYKDEFHEILQRLWRLEADDNFPNQLYETAKRVIGLENLANISFAIKLLENFGMLEWVRELENLTIDYITNSIFTPRRAFDNLEAFGEVRDKFKNYISDYNSNNVHLPTLIDAVFNKYIQEGWSDTDELAIEKANKQQWKNLLFTQIPEDPRFNDANSSYIVKKILQRNTSLNFGTSFRKLVTEIYEEKGKESDFYKNYMNFLISRLDN